MDRSKKHQRNQANDYSRKRICIVSDDFIGPIRNGGIGTACSTLGETLAKAGHDVTLLYTLGYYSETKPIDYWIQWYREKNIRFIPFSGNFSGVTIDAPPHISRSFEIYQWLKGNQFELIYFPEWRGRGYHTTIAKHQGLAFLDTTICVGVHSPSLWESQGSHEYLEHLDQVEVDYMERQSVAWADVVISPSQYMLDWMGEQGWSLPPQSMVRQNILPVSARNALHSPKEQFIKPNEIVFFGRLYRRKGLVVFCDALDYLAQYPTLRDLRITFLGKSVAVENLSSEEYIRQRSQQWPWQIQILTDYDQSKANQYLSGEGRLAVIASLMENSPYTVLECLGAEIPFICSDIGGIPELIHPDDRSSVCFTPTAQGLARKLKKAVEDGLPIARPAIPFNDTEKAWLEWVERLNPLSNRKGHETRSSKTEVPLVSVCLTHFNRPHYLSQALKSLRELTYPNYEVILVDDGSNKLEIIQYLRIIQPYFEEKGWKIIHQPNRYLGAARNTAARHAKGEYILFMDDDNYAKPHELEIFVRVAQRTQADILTCIMDLFTGSEPPNTHNHQSIYWIPLGPSITAGAYKNCFGDANALIRKDVFWKLGGFSEDYGVGHEDWELFARAVLQGYQLEVIPEALYYYRQDRGGMLRSGNMYLNHQRNLRPYLESVPHQLRQLICFSQGQKYLLDSLSSEVEFYRKQNSLMKDSNLFSDAEYITKTLIESESSSIDGIKILKKAIAMLPFLTDWKVKQLLLLICAGFFEKIQDDELALEVLSQAFQISTLLNDKNTIQQIEFRKQTIIENKAGEKHAQDILQKILSADDLFTALETYQNQLTSDVIKEIHRRAAKVHEEGETELAQGLEELAVYIAEIIRQRDAVANPVGSSV